MPRRQRERRRTTMWWSRRVRGAVAEALTARGEDDAVPERATARLDRDLEHVKAERDVARASFNKVKKAYDEIVEERRKREEQIERDRVRRMNRQAPENATTERLVRQKLERERNDARLELDGVARAAQGSGELPQAAAREGRRRHR